MAEKEGFEPPRRRRPPGFQDRSLQPDLGISPHLVPKAGLEPARDLTPAGFKVLCVYQFRHSGTSHNDYFIIVYFYLFDNTFF